MHSTTMTRGYVQLLRYSVQFEQVKWTHGSVGLQWPLSTSRAFRVSVTKDWVFLSLGGLGLGKSLPMSKSLKLECRVVG